MRTASERKRRSRGAAHERAREPVEPVVGDLRWRRMMGEGMVELPAGRVSGWVRTDFYPDEGPVRRSQVDGFAIDRGPVTVAQFARFTGDTGYVTLAERAPDPAQYPDADPSLLVAGSAVFHPTARPVPLDDPGRWWAYVPGADAPPLGTPERQHRAPRSSGNTHRI